jgi:biofilm PGA synthesis N-glycosyltransferase PgaC
MESILSALFWIFLALIFYAYLGYGILLYFLIKVRRWMGKKGPEFDPDFEPEVTLLVAAYNEEDFIAEKIRNSLALDYPREKLKLLFVTDGSDDRTPEIVGQFPEVRLMHEPERAGKIAAVQRAMPTVDTPITIYTDANTFLNPEAVRMMVRHYADEKVGAVSGEKADSQPRKRRGPGGRRRDLLEVRVDPQALGLRAVLGSRRRRRTLLGTHRAA